MNTMIAVKMVWLAAVGALAVYGGIAVLMNAVTVIVALLVMRAIVSGVRLFRARKEKDEKKPLTPKYSHDS